MRIWVFKRTPTKTGPLMTAVGVGLTVVVLAAVPWSHSTTPASLDQGQLSRYSGKVPPEFAIVTLVDDPRPAPRTSVVVSSSDTLRLDEGSSRAPFGYAFVWLEANVVNPSGGWLDWPAASISDLEGSRGRCHEVRWLPKEGDLLTPVVAARSPWGPVRMGRVPPHRRETRHLLFLCPDRSELTYLTTYYGYAPSKGAPVAVWHRMSIAVNNAQ